MVEAGRRKLRKMYKLVFSSVNISTNKQVLGLPNLGTYCEISNQPQLFYSSTNHIHRT